MRAKKERSVAAHTVSARSYGDSLFRISGFGLVSAYGVRTFSLPPVNFVNSGLVDGFY
jgi:hypothetical protein